MPPVKPSYDAAELEAAMAVGKDPEETIIFEDDTTGEHRVVPRVYIRPRSDYEDSRSARGKPSLHTIRFSPDGRVLAASLGNGRIAFYDAESGKTKYNADSGDPRHEKSLWDPEKNGNVDGRHKDYRESPMRMSYTTPGKQTGQAGQAGLIAETEDESLWERPAVTAMRWLPSSKCQEEGCYNLLTSNTDGVIQRWRLTSPYDPEMVTYRSPRVKRTGDDAGHDDYDFDGVRCIEAFETEKGYESRVLGLDYDYVGGKFAAACKDAIVRIYDEETSKCINTLDGGLGHDFEIGADFQMVGDMRRFYSVMERRRMQKISAMDVVRKAEIKELNKELKLANVNVIKRHSNRVYAVRFGRLSGQIAENLVASAGWDRTLQIWDVREKSASPIHSFNGAFVCGDAVDVWGNEVLVASHQEEDQITIFDLRAQKEPRHVYATKGNHMYAAGFSKGELEHDRFFCCGGIGGKNFDKYKTNNVHVIDVKRDFKLAATITDVPGGVVTLDWDPYTTHPPYSASPINSSKGSVPSVVVAIGCGNGEIQIHEICTQSSIKFCDDAEQDVVDGEEDDGDVFDDYIEKKYGWHSEEVKQVREQRRKHHGIPIPSDSPLHMIREKSKHFDFKSEETIILDGPNTTSPKTPGQSQEVGQALGVSSSEPTLASPSGDDEAIVGGPNKKNIKNLRVNANTGLKMSESLAQIRASPEVQVHSGEVGSVSVQEHGTFTRVTSTSVKKLKVAVADGGDGDDGHPGAHVAVVPPPLVGSPGHDLHDHFVSPKHNSNKRVQGRIDIDILVPAHGSTQRGHGTYEHEREMALVDHEKELAEIGAIKDKLTHNNHVHDQKELLKFEKGIAQRHVHDNDAHLPAGTHGETVETTHHHHHHHHHHADGHHSQEHGHGNGNGHNHGHGHHSKEETVPPPTKKTEVERAPVHPSVDLQDHGFRGEEDLELSFKR